MLAVMEREPAHSVGRGNGVVLFGFLFGYCVGASLFGLTVDRLGNYVLGWLATALVLVAAFGVAVLISRLKPAPVTSRRSAGRG